MRKTYIILLIGITLSLYGHNAFAQFIVAQDTVRGRIDFCPRPGDFNNMTVVPNDSVFYMFPPDKEIDPWRYVDFYTPSRTIKRGYILSTNLMRVDDYDIVEVERLSSHGAISFKNDDVRVNIAVAKVTPNDTSIKQNPGGRYVVKGKYAKGIIRGSFPKLRYQSISVTIKGKTIILPKNTYEHLFEPEIDNMVVYYNAEKSIVYIVTNNGGIDAYYSALWAVSSKGASSVYIFDPTSRE
ncbi:MAG: hypothetical protein ACK5KT_09960 [Dysgonomonas sp.]